MGGSGGWEAGHGVESSRSGMLTFADDPVEDGLQLLDADLHVLGEEGGGAFSTLRKGGPSVPPTTRPPRPAYLPCQLSEEGFEVLINLLF